SCRRCTVSGNSKNSLVLMSSPFRFVTEKTGKLCRTHSHELPENTQRQCSIRHFSGLGMLTEDLEVRNLSPNTQRSYLEQVSRFARHFSKSPELLGPEDIRAYQVYLTKEKQLAPGSIVIAVAALRFLYKVTLHREWNIEEVQRIFSEDGTAFANS